MADHWLNATLWIALALLASLISIRVGISIALIEIAVGAVAGNTIGLEVTEWVKFLAGLGSIMLTFLAGAEIEPDALRRHWKPALAIGLFSFLAPCLAGAAAARWALGWSPEASWIAGIVLSCTSVAVVYAVMVETGLNRRDVGKLILAACFVTDLGTVLALGVAFANWDRWMLVFLAASVPAVLLAPRLTEYFMRRYENAVSEPELKLLLVLLLGLGALAARARSEAVLPAYVLGLAVAGPLARHRESVRHLRVAAFALLTPFFFLKAGALIDARAVWAGMGAMLLLLAAKLTAKWLGVYPLCRAFGLGRPTAAYTTLLMSTGLTFGTIAALYGYDHRIIGGGQYAVLVAAVLASAVLPTIVAQKFFQPRLHLLEVQSEDEALAVPKTSPGPVSGSGGPPTPRL
ncbi:MAG TPA: cation:proton antiporter [Planctomycetota bacterium]|nr:cation:proton antiporter [Planctomycetota bacterium]